MKSIFTILLTAGVMATAVGQTRPSAPAAGQDSTRRPSAAPAKTPKPYGQVITDKAVSRRGLFTVHLVDNRYFFEIPNNVLNREFLVVSRISKAGSEVRDASGYAGDQIGSSVVKFEKGPNHRIFLRKISYSTYSPDSTKSMYQAVNRSNVAAIAGAFNISAYSEDNKASVIDVTDYINSDNEIFFFSSPMGKSRFGLGSQIADRSFINNIRSFPTNVEIGTTKTYNRANRPGSGDRSVPSVPPSGAVTIEVNTSLVALPEKPMQPRYFDPRVGYFAVGYTDFDSNPHGIRELGLVKRWRLEPKPEDVARYKRGELVEPAKPIVFYIDPATPKKWVPYLIKGINDWQKAFEKAGFKNAIIGKEAPTYKQDSTWSLDDARNSAIVYKPSEIPNASGPSISDPRTGEIMESHINWYHNVMKLVHDWYFIQTAAVDKDARKMTFSDELMGQLIRFVSSHEVGHTLGLRHNYGSSSTVPVEKLRDKAFVEANGHTPSIMDYARFNYVAQPEDNISEKGLFPRIGDYDMWAIEWGYRWHPEAKSPEAEKALLNKITMERLAANKRLWFGTEINPDDPRSQNEDLGDNAMKASEYGIKNLQRILPNLTTWTREPNETYENLEGMYRQLTTQFNRYMGHVTKNVGGIYETPKTVEQPGTVYQRTPAGIQREAVAFLDKQLFTTPKWILEPAVLDQIGDNPVGIISKLQEPTLNRLLSASTLNKVISSEALEGDRAYNAGALFTDLNNSIFREVKKNQAIDIYRRNLQKMYVDKLITIVNPPQQNGTQSAPRSVPTFSAPAQGDVVTVAKAELRNIDKMIKAASISDSMSSYHLQDISDRIQNALNPKG